MIINIEESDRQLAIRALAVQALKFPGFKLACRNIATTLRGEDLFDEFMSLMVDLFDPQYDFAFGDDKLCECGHAYYRHFDSYDDMAAVGCKYCTCFCFKESE